MSEPNPRAVIGGNNPPAFEVIKGRVDTLVAVANRWATERPAITDEDMAAKCSDFLDQVAAELKAAEERRVAEKKPHLDAAAAVDQLWNPLKAPLELIKRLLNPRLTVWLDAKRKRIEDERRQREAEAAEALRKADEAQRQAEATQQQGGDVIGTMLAADEAQRQADKAGKLADQAAGSRAQVKGVYGTRAKSLRTYWGFEVTDPKKVPRKFLVVDTAAINAAIRAADDPEKLAIPGIEIKSRQQAA